MPRRRASSGEAGAYGAPSSAIVPASGAKRAGEHVHQRALAGAVLADERVDLAAAQIERSTPSSATVGPKRLRMPVSVSTHDSDMTS